MDLRDALILTAEALHLNAADHRDAVRLQDAAHEAADLLAEAVLHRLRFLHHHRGGRAESVVSVAATSQPM